MLCDSSFIGFDIHLLQIQIDCCQRYSTVKIQHFKFRCWKR